MGYEAVGEAIARELLETALAAGINLLDTAECYGGSEEMIGRVLEERRSDFLLLTKCGHASGLPSPDWSPETVSGNIERSLRRLRTDYVDFLLLHSCSEEALRDGSVVEPLVQARAAGKARFIGYSGDGQAARTALEMDVFDCLGTSINIADQEAIDLLLPTAAERQIAVTVKRPIANAAWKVGDRPPNEYGRPYFERLKQLRYPFLDGPVQTAIATALAFVLSVPGVHCAVMGTKSPARLRENLAIASGWQAFRNEYEPIRTRWNEVAQPGWVGLT